MFGTPDTVIQTHVSILTAKSPIPQLTYWLKMGLLLVQTKLLWDLTDTLQCSSCQFSICKNLMTVDVFPNKVQRLFHI